MRIERVVSSVVAAGLAVGLAACEARTSTGKGAEKPPAPAAGGAPKAGGKPWKEITPSTDYPLTTCVVSGEKLGEIGEPTAIEYQGTEVQFCCPDCLAEFEKDPAKYVAKVKAAKK